MELECITFRVENEHYANLVHPVIEVMLYQQPTPVPGSPANVEGILNVRGKVVTVLSGRRIFGLQENTATNDWRIMIFDSPHGMYGVTVDAVDEIVRFDETRVEITERVTQLSIYKGTVNHAHYGLLIFIDLERALDEMIEDK